MEEGVKEIKCIKISHYSAGAGMCNSGVRAKAGGIMFSSVSSG